MAGSRTATGGVGALLQIHDHSGGDSGDYLAAYDGNGNLTALYNAADGSEEAVYEYSPFGELIRVTGDYADENPFRFSTKFTDDETGLVYYGHRYYSPALGRFINRDPIGEAGGLNLYGFVGNNPISGIDVLGLDGHWSEPPPPPSGYRGDSAADYGQTPQPWDGGWDWWGHWRDWEWKQARIRADRDRKIRERKAETDAAAENNRAQMAANAAQNKASADAVRQAGVSPTGSSAGNTGANASTRSRPTRPSEVDRPADDQPSGIDKQVVNIAFTIDESVKDVNSAIETAGRLVRKLQAVADAAGVPIEVKYTFSSNPRPTLGEDGKQTIDDDTLSNMAKQLRSVPGHGDYSVVLTNQTLVYGGEEKVGYHVPGGRGAYVSVNAPDNTLAHELGHEMGYRGNAPGDPNHSIERGLMDSGGSTDVPDQQYIDLLRVWSHQQ